MLTISVYGGKKMDNKLLIVDDDHNICDLLKLYFENENYKRTGRNQ